MMRLRGGSLLGIGLAAGLAIGVSTSARAAGPSAKPSPAPWASMMTGSGMMGGSSGVNPGMTSGAGMMGGSAQHSLQACDAMHDAMHGSDEPQPSAPTTTR